MLISVKSFLKSLVIDIKKLVFRKRLRNEKQDPVVMSDAVNVEEQPDRLPTKKTADVLTYDAKKSVFVVKKRCYSVALYDTENYAVHTIKVGEVQQTINLKAYIGHYCLPFSGNWFHAAQADIGLYNSEMGSFFLYNTENKTGQTIDTKSYKKQNKLEPVTGDWMGDGKQSIGLFDKKNSAFLIKTLVDKEAKEKLFSFGSPDYEGIPLVGDWDGDGKDSIGLYLQEQGLFFLHNCLDECLTADMNFYFGPKNQNMIPIVGDWNGDGKDKIGLYSSEQGLFFLPNKNEGMDEVDNAFYFGPKKLGLMPVVGDWKGEGTTGIGVYDPETLTFYLTQKLAGGLAEMEFKFSDEMGNSLPFVMSYIA